MKTKVSQPSWTEKADTKMETDMQKIHGHQHL
jgi:hypothetical protein